MVFSLGLRLLHALRGQERNRICQFAGVPAAALAFPLPWEATICPGPYRVFMMEPMDKSAGTGTDAGDDMRLVARVRAGDSQALAELYDRYSSVVYAVGLRILQDAGAAEDILQDIFLQLWRKPEAFDSSRGSLGAWLAVIARHRSIDRLRQRRPESDI